MASEYQFCIDAFLGCFVDGISNVFIVPPDAAAIALVSNREVGDETGMQTPNGMVMAKPVRFEKLRERISEALATAAH